MSTRPVTARDKLEAMQKFKGYEDWSRMMLAKPALSEQDRMLVHLRYGEVFSRLIRPKTGYLGMRGRH